MKALHVDFNSILFCLGRIRNSSYDQGSWTCTRRGHARRLSNPTWISSSSDIQVHLERLVVRMLHDFLGKFRFVGQVLVVLIM